MRSRFIDMLAALAAIVTLSAALGAACAFAAESAASPLWKDKFDNLCGQVNAAQEYDVERIERLIAECDALLVEIASVEEPSKKVYLYRLKLCRDYFVYMRDFKLKPGGGQSP